MSTRENPALAEEEYEFTEALPVAVGDTMRLSVKLPITLDKYEIGDVTADVTISVLPEETSAETAERLEDIVMTNLFAAADRYVETVRLWQAERNQRKNSQEQ